jgi:hypothetical protein
MEEVFFLGSQCLISSVRKSLKSGLGPGGRGIGIVVADTRKRLVTD